MPRYDYDCPTCGVFELEHSIKQDSLKTCPTCGSPIKLLVSIPIVRWVGGPPTLYSTVRKWKDIFGVGNLYPDKPDTSVYGKAGKGTMSTRRRAPVNSLPRKRT